MTRSLLSYTRLSDRKVCLQFEQITWDRRDNQALIVEPSHKATCPDGQGQIITVNHSSKSTPAPASGGTAEVSVETDPFHYLPVSAIVAPHQASCVACHVSAVGCHCKSVTGHKHPWWCTENPPVSPGPEEVINLPACMWDWDTTRGPAGCTNMKHAK